MVERELFYTILYGLKTISREKDDFCAKEINAFLKLLDDNKFKIAVIGEFSVGKSTFLNAIMGRRILYSSNNEATGAITCIQASNRKEAYIYTDGDMTILELEDSSNFGKLTEHINIQNEERAKMVEILYPLSILGSSLVLIDTPGLAGISEEQTSITREILKEVNAIIMLVSPKGLEETELNLLIGKDERFGQIDNHNIFVVINQIGRIYDNGSNEVGNILKVNKLIEEVMKALKDNGLNYKVFALDSRDFLWSRDNDLYNMVRQSSEGEEILSQKEYEIRSRFKEFQEYLNAFLYGTDIERKFEEDMKKRLHKLIKDFESMLKEEEQINKRGSKKHIEDLQKQKKLILQNRKAITNQLIRYEKDSLYTILDSIKTDIEALKVDIKTIIGRAVQELFKEEADFNEENSKGLSEKISARINAHGLKFANSINYQYKLIVTKLLNKKFIESVAKIAEGKVEFSLNISIKPVVIESSANNINLNQSPIIDERMQEIQEIENQIEKLQIKKNSIDQINVEWTIKKLYNKKAFLKKEYEEKINSLRSRPEGKVVFKEVEEKDGWLMFKRNVRRRYREGVDYEEAIEWENEKEKIVNDYLDGEEIIDEEIEKYKRLLTVRETLQKEITMLKEEQGSIKQSIEEIKKDMEKRRKNDIEAYLSRRRNEIYKVCSLYAAKAYQGIAEQAENSTYEIMKDIKEEIQKGMEKFIVSFSQKLDAEINEIEENAEEENTTGEYLERIHKYEDMTR